MQKLLITIFFIFGSIPAMAREEQMHVLSDFNTAAGLAAALDFAKTTSDHKPAKPHICQVCGHRFEQKNHLVKHQRTHTGERPFTCTAPGCGLRCASLSNLRVHERIHTDERPHTCAICNSRFKQRSHLTTHIHTHGNKKACPYCTKPYKQPRGLMNHIKTKHPELFEQWKAARSSQRAKRAFPASSAPTDLLDDLHHPPQIHEPFEWEADVSAAKRVCIDPTRENEIRDMPSATPFGDPDDDPSSMSREFCEFLYNEHRETNASPIHPALSY